MRRPAPRAAQQPRLDVTQGRQCDDLIRRALADIDAVIRIVDRRVTASIMDRILNARRELEIAQMRITDTTETSPYTHK